MKSFDIIKNDTWLSPFADVIKSRFSKYEKVREELLGDEFESLSDFSNGYSFFGCFKDIDEYIFREWLPNASHVYLIGDFSEWKAEDQYAFCNNNGIWELKVKGLKHGDLYRIKVVWDGGEGERIPAWARYVVQDEETHVFSAQIWFPEKEYQWQNTAPANHEEPLIYEAHIGMAGESEKVASFNEFREHVLPRINALGYNTIQLMAIQEHPYYGSFGYHVSSFFAVSSRFGTPEDLKQLIDEAHGLGIRIIMDMVHSHAVKNEIEGLGNYDGTRTQFFHDGTRGEHPAWDSFCFDYGKHEVQHFLLSNIKFWMDEFRFDGYRFDGVTSMLYFDHGLERDFTAYEYYFDGGQDEDAIVYLMLANTLMHQINHNMLSVAEEMSGYPGVATPIEQGGLGFSYRLAMGIPDFWIKTLKEKKDEEWELGQIFHELTSKRADEKTISYTESHDQALVGDKTIAFWLMDKEMYFNMAIEDQSLDIDRGIALHKMIRLMTIACSGGGYLNFIGNEFGHPDWIDFPREGNDWSYKHATRQWSLVDREDLKFKYLNKFDQQMIQWVKSTALLKIYPVNLHDCNEENKVIAFSRGEYILVFNFNATNSYTDYGIPVSQGRYKYVLSTDELDSGGFGRIDETQQFRSMLVSPDGVSHQVKMYLPARSAVIIERLPTPNVHERLKKKSD